MRRIGHGWSRAVRSLWIVVVAALLWWGGAWHAAASEAGSGVFTAEVQIDVPLEQRLGPNDYMWIAFGLAGETDATLRVLWHQEAQAWFPVWKLSLFGPAEMMPAGKEPQEQPDGEVRVDLASTVAPVAGHTYDVTLAHAGEGGAFTLRIVDSTVGREVISVGLTGVAEGLSLHDASAGMRLAGSEREAPVALHDFFTPVASWLFARAQPDGKVTYLTGGSNPVEPGDTIALELNVPSGAPGLWQVALESAAGRAVLAQLSGVAGSHSVDVLTVPADAVGRYTLLLQYVDGERVVLSHPVYIMAGRLDVRLDPPKVRDDGEVAVDVHVASTFPATLDVSLTAEIFEIVWDAERLRYTDVPVDGAVETFRLPFEVTPTQPAQAEVVLPVPRRSGTFRVKYTVRADNAPDVALRVHGEDAIIDLSAATDADEDAFEFRVVTYNIWATVMWPMREPALRAVITQMQPDILALQELRPQTLLVLDKILPNHQRVASPFQGWFYEGNIYWAADRFDLVEYGAEEIGIYEEWRRLFWVRLRPKGSDQTLLVATAHYTWNGHPRIKAEGGNPRLEQARRTVEALQRLAQPGEPVIFMGDLNESGEALDILRQGGLRDSLGTKGEPIKHTHPADPNATGPRVAIDWQFHAGPLRVVEGGPVDFILDGMAPSDHKPVLVTYRLE